MLLLILLQSPVVDIQPPPVVQDSLPLTADELRVTATNLLDGLAAKDKAKFLESQMAAMEEIRIMREQLLNERVDDEKARTALAQKEAAFERDRAEFYRQSFEQVSGGRSFWCGVAKVFTLGLAKCS